MQKLLTGSWAASAILRWLPALILRGAWLDGDGMTAAEIRTRVGELLAAAENDRWKFLFKEAIAECEEVKHKPRRWKADPDEELAQLKRAVLAFYEGDTRGAMRNLQEGGLCQPSPATTAMVEAKFHTKEESSSIKNEP